MTDDERAQLRRAWQPVGEALLGLEAARQIEGGLFWGLVNALIGFRRALKEIQVLESDEEVSDNDR